MTAPSDYSPLAIFTDPQLLALADAFETASMETSLTQEAFIAWYAVLEEVARRDLMDEDTRAEEADWIVSHLFPEPRRAMLAAAEADYPLGGYLECEGGLRCRGTLVAVY